MTSAFSWQKSVRYCPGSFVPKGQTCLLLEISLDFLLLHLTLGFPDSSVGKESTCNAGDLGSIPGLRRSPGEGKGYPLQYSGLENSMDCSLLGHKESDMTERLSLSLHFHLDDYGGPGNSEVGDCVPDLTKMDVLGQKLYFR